MKKLILGLLLASLFFTPIAFAETYKVKKGDTLTRIAHQYHIRVKKLRGMNHLHSDRIYPGQRIDIPSTLHVTKKKPPARHPFSFKSHHPQKQIAQDLKRRVHPLLGTQYVWGGSTPRGFDCSGFTSYVLEAFGLELPRTAAQQFRVGENVPVKELQPGDLLFFDTLGEGRITHVSLYIGNGKLVHAVSPKVKFSRLEYYLHHYRYYGARRVL